MRATRWTATLAGACSEDGLTRLTAGLGFGVASPLDTATRRAIGLTVDSGVALVAAGPGTARILLLRSEVDSPVRDQARAIATGLCRRAPHLLWLLALVVPERQELIIAAWRAGTGAPRIAALVVDCRRVLPSDAETMEALADSMDAGDLVIHSRWLEVLGREAISRRFYDTLQRIVLQLADGAEGRAADGDRREVALLHVSRMLFLSFIESRGWLDGNRRFLSRLYDRCMASGGGYQRRILEPLFFGTLNTPAPRRARAARAFGNVPFLNGGLFMRSAAEVRGRALVLRDADWGLVHDALLLRYRFSAAEETPEWQEAAIDPEILGRAFESLMVARERRLSGAYFTPLVLVQRTSDTALESLLESRGVAEGTLGRVIEGVTLDSGCADGLRRALADLRIIDPACGSGAFLVHVLERLTRLRIAAGDRRTPSLVRREIVSSSIFGVDVNPTAVWLCELRLWLAIVMEHPGDDPARVPPLPNLDHNVQCGDALAGGDFALAPAVAAGRDPATLRARYARATGSRKRSLGRELDRLERARALAWLDARLDQVAASRCSLVSAARGRDLFGVRRGSVAGEREALRQARGIARGLRRQRRAVASGGALPFAFTARFPDAAAAGGFDLVVGNPPWVRLHNIPPAQRAQWRREFRVYRDAAWVSGAREARAGTGFGSQVDVSALFIERGVRLLCPGGVLSFLVPSKLWRSLAGGGVRRFLSDETRLLALEDWSDAPPAFEATTYPSLLAVRRGTSDSAESRSATGPGDPGVCRLAVHRGRLQVVWRASRRSIPLDESPGAPWISLPPDARAAFDRVTRRGVALADAGLGTVTLGAKSGCNAAYLVREVGSETTGTIVTDGERRGVLEARYLRPVLRGESVRAWVAGTSDERIVFPHGADGRVLPRLPDDVRNWLRPWRARLEARSDARPSRAWWSLFRLEGAGSGRPRVVWADIGRSLQALVLPAGDQSVPLNTCYVLPTRDETDALALATLLNSALANAWLGSICEPARGGYRRHFAWSMARLPVPDDWARARELLAPVGERAVRGDRIGRSELLTLVLDAYRLTLSSVSPLLAWMSD